MHKLCAVWHVSFVCVCVIDLTCGESGAGSQEAQDARAAASFAAQHHIHVVCAEGTGRSATTTIPLPQQNERKTR